MQHSPMLPLPPPVAICSACHSCYFLADADEVGQYPRFKGRHPDPDDVSETPRAWRHAPKVIEPSENQYYAAIDAGIHGDDEAKLKKLRMLAWWRANKPYRDWKRLLRRKVRRSPKFQANILALAELLGDQEEFNRIIRAEICRELADFDAARNWLDTAADREYARVVARLRTLCDERDMMVHNITDAFDTNHRARLSPTDRQFMAYAVFVLTVLALLIIYICR